MMPLSASQEIDALRSEIERHNHLYYVTNLPTLSDAEYDALYRKLQDLEAKHPELITPDSPTQRVGTEPSGSFASIEHSIPMLSFANAFNEEDLRDFDCRVRSLLDTDDVTYVAEPKLDGPANHFNQLSRSQRVPLPDSRLWGNPFDCLKRQEAADNGGDFLCRGSFPLC